MEEYILWEAPIIEICWGDSLVNMTEEDKKSFFYLCHILSIAWQYYTEEQRRIL